MINVICLVFYSPGMFATVLLQENEVLCQYKGTMKYLTEKELQQLEAQHEDDGNGLLQIDQAMGCVSGTPSIKKRAWVLDPYVVDGVRHDAVSAVGVWANHCLRGRPGYNMKLVGRGKVGPQYRAFLVTTTSVPAGMELRWDYGIRDPTKPWLN